MGEGQGAAGNFVVFVVTRTHLILVIFFGIVIAGVVIIGIIVDVCILVAFDAGGDLYKSCQSSHQPLKSEHAHSGIFRQHSALKAWLLLSTPRASVFHLAASSVTNLSPAVQYTDWPLCCDRHRHAACCMKLISRAFATCRDYRAEGHCARAVCHSTSQSPLEAV